MAFQPDGISITELWLLVDSEPGRSLILWTARCCVALYGVALWEFTFRKNSPTVNGKACRLAWGGSWLLCMIHVGFAFHFEHHWSHAAAVEHTANLTKRVIGLDWGGGLYANHVFLIWWGGDVVRQLRSSASNSSRTIHAVAAFMMINATVIFGPVWWSIPVGIFSFALLLRRAFVNSAHQSR